MPTLSASQETLGVGHGKLGLRTAMRPMLELEQQSSRRPHAWIEVDAWRTLSTTWSSLGAGLYRQAWNYSFRGRMLDATLVFSEDEELSRMVTEADCAATEGTYFLDYDASRVYVHLTGGTDPATVEMLGVTTFPIWNGAKDAPWLGIQPILGSDHLTDGALDVWTNPSTLTGWNKAATGAGHTLARNVSITDGTFCAALASSGIGGGSITIDQAIDLKAIGQKWRLSWDYKANKLNPLSAPAVFTVNVGTADGIASDGRNTQTGVAGLAITQHLGAIRRGVFDFVAHEVSSTLRFAMSTAAPSIVSVQIDNIRLRPIFAWAYGSPRLGAHTSWEESFNDVCPGSRTTGIGAVELVNGDRYFEEMFSPATSSGWLFDGRSVRVKCGGQFLHDQQEILYEDMYPAFSGKTTRVQVGDATAHLDLEEEQSILETLLPIDSYTEGSHPDASPNVWNRARAMLYGTKSNITPARIDADGTTGFGIHEYVNTERWSGGVQGTNLVESLLNGDETEQKRVTLVVGKDYTDDISTGALTLLADVRVIEITAENNILDFNIGAGALKAVIAPGLYTIGYGGATVADRRGLLEAVRAALVAAGVAATVNVTCDTSTHLVNIDLAGKGALNLLWQTGLNAHVSIGPTLGYRGDADDNAGVSHTGDDALFTSADESETLRVRATGYKDDGVGTYTGTPLSTIRRGNSIMQHIWRVFLGQPEVDSDSFGTFADTTSLAVYLGVLASVNGGQSGQVSARDVFSTIANSNAAQYQFDGTGKLYYSVRVDTAPSDAVTIPETHYQAFEGYLDQTETYGTVRINHSQDPSTGFVQGVEETRTITVKGNRRTQVRTFDTYMTNDTDAQAKMPFFVAQTRTPLRHIPTTIKGRAMRVKLGDMIKLDRTKGLLGVGETTLVGSEFRIKLRRTFTDHTCELLLHTAVIA